MRRTCTCGHRWVGFGQCGALCPLLEPPQPDLEVVPSKSRAGPLDHNMHSVRTCLKVTLHTATPLPRIQRLMPLKFYIAVLAPVNEVICCANCVHGQAVTM